MRAEGQSSVKGDTKKGGSGVETQREIIKGKVGFMRGLVRVC